MRRGCGPKRIKVSGRGGLLLIFRKLKICNSRLWRLLRTKKCFLTQKSGCMKKVADILSHKGARITSVSPQTTVLDALRIMADQNIGSVLVVEGNQYLGIMTERDYSRKVILKGKSSTDTPVAEIMSKDFPGVTPNDTVEFCMELMSDKNIRYLPVFENEQLCGIVSINDLVRETIRTHEETITHLKDYLHSGI